MLPLLLLFTGCVNYALKPDLDIQYFENVESAPKFKKIDIVECYGPMKFMEMPTFEEALAEAKYKAKEKNGNVVIFLKSVRAIDIDNGFDITKFILYLSLDENTAQKVNSHIDDNLAEDQLVWYFIIGKIES